ncbi:DUF3299 domain-containing protein [Thalassotalea euphylliae]|nr:DUF3299 domain-containing protein [Thalassotalea euphylliae]
MLLIAGVLLSSGCSESQQGEEISTQVHAAENPNEQVIEQVIEQELMAFSDGSHLKSGVFRSIEWGDLIPEDDLQALLNPPDFLIQIEDGSAEDQITSTIQNAMAANKAANNAANGEKQIEPYEQALVSTNIIEAMNGQKVRIPGFVVPLEFNDNQVVTSFFLVPFFGACIHAPPPPPNQIIFVESERGFALENLYEPIWVSGKLATELFEDQLATAAYTMRLTHIEKYDG